MADGYQLGKLLDGGELVLDPDDLTTHAVIVGMTGSGKTGLGIVLLEEAGYKTVEDLLREDEDRLAIRTGLGIKKARAIKQGAREFMESEQKVLEAARADARRVADAAAVKE